MEQFIPQNVNSSAFNMNLHMTIIKVVWTPVDMCYAGQFDLLHSTAIRPILHSTGARVAAGYGFPSIQ